VPESITTVGAGLDDGRSLASGWPVLTGALPATALDAREGPAVGEAGGIESRDALNGSLEGLGP